MSDRNDRLRSRTRTRLAALLLSALAALPVAAAGPGYVDGSGLVKLAGDEAVTVDVHVTASLLKLSCSFDEALCELVGGLESVRALTLDLGLAAQDDDESRELTARARDLTDRMEKRLRRSGWERLALVRDGSSTVRLLLRTDGEIVQGLVVLALDGDEVAFVNVAGEIDLARLRELGEELEVPGLEDLDLDELKEK